MGTNHKAKAPRPGVGTRQQASADASKVMTITIRGESLDLAVGLLPISERLQVRKATGLPFEDFVGGDNKIGLDSVLVLWWLARRANDEPNLSWAEAVDQFPTDLTEGDVTVDVDEPDGDSPEA
jgi:hypothetical protein